MSLWKIFTSVKSIPRLLHHDIVVVRRCCNENRTASEIKADRCAEKKPEGCIKKGVVLGLYDGDKDYTLSAAADEVNQKSDGKICKYLNEMCGQIKHGDAYILTDVLPDTVVAVTSLGPKDPGYNQLETLDETRENVRLGVGAGVSVLKRQGCTSVSVDTAGAPEAAAEAAQLAAWRFEEFKSPNSKSPSLTVSAYGASSPQWEKGYISACCQNWARYLADMPANKMTPSDLAQAALDMLCPLGVMVEARDIDWIKSNNMQAFLAVARGSCETPIFLECNYNGGGGEAPVLLAAKGVTFDSGGLCLKRAKSMEENRGSMAGAAACLAALKAAAIFKIPLNISCVIPICENMVSGQCMKVGDVVRALNGLSIQIENTDMEGRLMLADALVYGQHKYKPSLVVDVATFTHGILLAMGGGAFGCFSNSPSAWQHMQIAGAVTGDRPWRFPLWHYYQNQITNEPAVDLRNRGSGHATPCLGAAFLQNFICGPWVHLDITGVGKLGAGRAPPYLSPRRMTGRPTRTLVQFLQIHAKKGKTCIDGEPTEKKDAPSKSNDAACPVT